MKENLRSFFIKLFAISIAVIIIINLIFNILLGERLEKIDKIISLGDSSTRNEIKLKIRSELNKGLDKENIFSKEDKVLIYKIYKKIQKEFEESVSDSNGGIVFLEAALLIEANWYKVCGHIWVVSLDPTVALRRLKERDNLSETEAKLRVGAQLDQKERLTYADVVLQNEGTPEELFTKTQQALRELKQSMNSSHS